jgi:hypothetical protein
MLHTVCKALGDVGQIAIPSGNQLRVARRRVGMRNHKGTYGNHGSDTAAIAHRYVDQSKHSMTASDKFGQVIYKAERLDLRIGD